jgi:hypothetical protein
MAGPAPATVRDGHERWCRRALTGDAICTRALGDRHADMVLQLEPTVGYVDEHGSPRRSKDHVQVWDGSSHSSFHREAK